MKRTTVLVAAVAAMAVGAAPASASLPVVGQGNVSDITQGDDAAIGGIAHATGGDGGNASTGNTQVLNGNSAAVSVLGDADSEGGDTSAKSGDAYGGNGGDAKARGGDADASDSVRSGQADSGHGYGEGSRTNDSRVEQGDDKAYGGPAYAEGGDGGDADTGNKQFGNGNSLAISPGGEKRELSSRKKGGRHESKARSEGGDTSAKSGDAYGGNGGDAKARGGDADASDHVDSRQAIEGNDDHREWGDDDGYGKDRERGCGDDRGKGRGDDRGKRRDKKGHQENKSWVKQGDDKAFGGPAFAEGGDGGDADTGNTQFLNGNSLAFSVFGDADSEGGDTCATSGDAYGGNGGDAKAIGGDADASDVAKVRQGSFSGGGLL